MHTVSQFSPGPLYGCDDTEIDALLDETGWVISYAYTIPVWWSERVVSDNQHRSER